MDDKLADLTQEGQYRAVVVQVNGVGQVVGRRQQRKKKREEARADTEIGKGVKVGETDEATNSDRVQVADCPDVVVQQLTAL